ncbi:MAG: hypothetical protein GF408_04130 [Candidatus Omnitrophica bacterium]|nr:hypothetical protein [Candidatus Omnitrophota bacterium]
MSEERKARCPECGAPVEIEDYDEVGDVIVCENCDNDLELVQLLPPRLKLVAREEGDEEDEDGVLDFPGKDDDWE